MQESAQRKTPTGLIVAFWLLVGVPLVWGVANTIMTAAALFR
ncbi:oxalate:formate antiporter [Advenella sp. S44]|nr:oxalate:formate antiporter [Advenella sp. S44]